MSVSASNIKLFTITLFLIDIMVIYPFFNTLGEYYLMNRLVVITLVLTIIVLHYKKLIINMISLPDILSLLVLLYLTYICISFLVYSSITGLPLIVILSFALHVMFPLVFYFVFLHYHKWTMIVPILLFLTLLNIVIGISLHPLFPYNMINYVDPKYADAIQVNVPLRLSSFIGASTILGYMAQLSFAYVLFFYNNRYKILLMLIFLVGAILTFQRGVWAGLFIAVFIYFLDKKNWRLRNFRIILTFILFSTMFFTSIIYYLEIDTMMKLFLDKIVEFNIWSAIESRAFQQVIFNDNNIFFIIFGEGFGKYSALNPLSIFKQPDAPYFMIYNETGIIGIVLFLSIFLYTLICSIYKGNYFMVYFVSHLLIHLTGSRIIWYFPINFIIFIMMAGFNSAPKLRFEI